MNKQEVIQYLKNHGHVLREEEYIHLIQNIPCVRAMKTESDGTCSFTFDDFSQVQFYIVRTARAGRGQGEPQSQI